jgi:hypothetical protein
MGIAYDGVPLSALTFREHAALGAGRWALLMQVLPCPLLDAGQPASEPGLGGRPAGRAGARWPLALSDQNVERHAAYLATSIRGEHGRDWSVPLLCLWSPVPLAFPDEGAPTGWLPPATDMRAVDGETAVAAMHRVSASPDRFGITPAQVMNLLVPFEVYWGISADDARQIFRNRNL